MFLIPIFSLVYVISNLLMLSSAFIYLFFQEDLNSPFELLSKDYCLGQERASSNTQRKTKIVCTIGPCTSTREMIWKLAEAGMNVARLNMSHGDHASHQKTIDMVKEYNAQFEDKVIAIMLDTKVSQSLA